MYWIVSRLAACVSSNVCLDRKMSWLHHCKFDV